MSEQPRHGTGGKFPEADFTSVKAATDTTIQALSVIVVGLRDLNRELLQPEIKELLADGVVQLGAAFDTFNGLRAVNRYEQ